ncbi:hypothetical protein BS78_06G067800 [Paspalum vaginatum]|nr:hypothetical protein BS78_06G067800 [Paspalum vaginatum]
MTLRSSVHSLGNSNGSAGCSRRVSLMTSFRYVRSCRSSSVTAAFPRSRLRTSACAFSIALGFLMSSDMAHSIVVAVVSLPPLKSFDDVHGERHLEAAFLVYPQQHLKNVLAVFLRRHGGHRRSALLVLPHGAVHKLEGLLMDRHHLIRRPAEEFHKPRRGEQVAEVEPRDEPAALLDRPQELLPALEPVAHHHPHRGVGGERGDPLADVDGLARRGGGEAGHEAPGLALPDPAERAHSPGAEQLLDAHPAELPPQRAVAREHQPHGAPLHGRPHAGNPRPRRERGVVCPHDLPGRVPGRGHDEPHLAELEVHEWRAVPPREVRHGPVREPAAEEQEVVEAADDRQPPRARGQPPLASVAAAPVRREEQSRKNRDEESHQEDAKLHSRR